jgi:hypothetical protein
MSQINMECTRLGTPERLGHFNMRHDQGWGETFPSDMKFDERMVSFGYVVRRRGMMVILGALVREGVRHTQRKRRFMKVIFIFHIKQQGNITKKA